LIAAASPSFWVISRNFAPISVCADQCNLGDSEFAQAVHEGLLERADKEAARTGQLPSNLVREFGIISYSRCPRADTRSALEADAGMA